MVAARDAQDRRRGLERRTVGFVALLLYLDKSGQAAEHSLLWEISGVGLLVSFMSFFAAWMVVAAVNGIRETRQEKRLAEVGVATTGEVVRVKQTGGSVNDQPQLEIWLRVELPGQDPYVAVHCQVIEQLFLSRVQLTERVPIVVDPSQTALMRIETTRWET